MFFKKNKAGEKKEKKKSRPRPLKKNYTECNFPTDWRMKIGNRWINNEVVKVMRGILHPF
jgi:hypothetical protein